MPTSRKPQHPNPLRVNAKLMRARSDQSEGALRVLERQNVLFGALLARDAILQEHAGDADRIEPVANLCSLQVHGQNVVAAAGTDEHRRPVVVARWRRVNSKGW